MHLPLPTSGVTERLAARRWLALALSVLVFAGLFALAVVVGRTPPFDRFVTDPLFFKRCLVAHVNLALVAWFYSFLLALLMLLPSRRRAGAVARHAVFVAAAGVGCMVVGAALPSGTPVLANYIPTIQHPIFRAGQLLFALGILAGMLTRRLWLPGPGDDRTGMPAAVQAGLRCLALALALAGVTLAVTAATNAAGRPFDVRYDLLVWGVGHVLQLVSVIGMVTVWMLLLTPVLKEAPVSAPAASALFIALLLPWMSAPLFALAGTDHTAYRHGFTHLMRWGLFPIVIAFLALCAGALARARRDGRITRASLADPRLSAFLVSAALTLLGFALGAVIRGSNTMVPAHYHAAVGGVTVAFMAATLGVLPVFRVVVPGGRTARAAAWQPVAYGLGMLIFALGFGLAGAHGMGRKLYGAEQAARGVPETIGLALMGVGGLVAIAGGVLFLAIVIRFWVRGSRVTSRDADPLPPQTDVHTAGRSIAHAGTSWRTRHETRRS